MNLLHSNSSSITADPSPQLTQVSTHSINKPHLNKYSSPWKNHVREQKRDASEERHENHGKKEMRETERLDILWRWPTESITEPQMLSPVAEARLSYLVSMEISISSASSRGPRGSRLQLTWLKHPSCCPTRTHVILHDPRKQRIRAEGAVPSVCQNEKATQGQQVYAVA